jgi:hypothetical protein
MKKNDRAIFHSFPSVFNFKYSHGVSIKLAKKKEKKEKKKLQALDPLL